MDFSLSVVIFMGIIHCDNQHSITIADYDQLTPFDYGVFILIVVSNLSVSKSKRNSNLLLNLDL